MKLSPGAVQLPTSNLSVRVPWHDTDWTGRVCTAPGENNACSALKGVKEKKDIEAEEGQAGRTWGDSIEAGVRPACLFERAGFMRDTVMEPERRHRFERNPAFSHYAPTPYRMLPYSFEVTPYRWMLRNEYKRYSDAWQIGVDSSLEESADKLMGYEGAWIQDHRNQGALLDTFFSALQPGKSLVLIYAKDVPLVEERAPGERFLVGAGFVKDIAASREWAYDPEPAAGQMRSLMWERSVTHSIRPGFDNGFLLPYQALLRDPALQGEDLSRFVARTTTDQFDEFSFVSELVSQDGAISALAELARVVDLLKGVLDGPWGSARDWLADRIADAWRARGPYPGLGPMLVAAGIDRGALIAHRVAEELPDGAPIWTALGDAIEHDRHGLAGRTSKKAWTRLTGDADRFRQLRVMSRFAVSAEQARRLFDGLTAAGVIDNPYALYEADRGEPDAVPLATVDRGLWPQDAAAKAALEQDPLDDPVTEPSDDRRVRAGAVEVLERAADRGHTLLDEPGLRIRLGELDLTPGCEPVDAAFAIAREDFTPVLVERELAKGAGAGWQLARLADAGDLIATAIRARAEGAALELEWDWRARIDDVIDEALPTDEALRKIEERARDEKARALRVLARSRVSVLIGPAGTGKTTMLEALCRDPQIAAGGVLLLAPTGKARVQMAARVGAPAKTIAQFLRPERWDEVRGYRLNPEAPPSRGARTLVIDEASMLTEQMLASVIEGVAGVDRLVLCGDPRQLPPIGAGRPFADTVAFLRDVAASDAPVAELTIGRRQLPRPGGDARVRDDVAIASMFSLDAVDPSADEALGRAFAGEGDGTFELVNWTDERDLHAKLVEVLCGEGLGLGDRDAEALVASFGAVRPADGDRPRFDWGRAGAGAEHWQLLTPVRARPGGVAGLNRLVRATWRSGNVGLARRSWSFANPAGADEVVFNDKVMCLRNDHRRRGWAVKDREVVDGAVANGEIGLIVWKATEKGRKAPWGIKVEFSTQPDRQYTFSLDELNGDSESHGEWLELAYAVTIHKSQGSQFGTTFVVVPDPCPLLSPELLYTALTRQRDRVVVLKQGDVTGLRAFADPARSETARRLTCLFRPADPFTTPAGITFDGSHVHRTINGELVLSKSEVIVANALHARGVDYGYEVELRMADGTWRLPDFTIERPGGPPVYWEHLGMLDRPGYAAGWEAKKAWYAEHGILPWTEGGGPDGTLVWSTESQHSGIDAQAIDSLVAEVFT